MQKIPTLFRRDPDHMARVLPEVHPDCAWVLAGEGTATRKYDGTCVMLDDKGMWWARREVKPGKTAPANYQPVMTDSATGKTVGWEPVGQSSFAKAFLQAYSDTGTRMLDAGTYELCGPKVNGNPEKYERHTLIRHADAEAIESDGSPRTFDALRGLVLALRDTNGWEGIVWHHPDGRMAKLKARDFPTP